LSPATLVNNGRERDRDRQLLAALFVHRASLQGATGPLALDAGDLLGAFGLMPLFLVARAASIKRETRKRGTTRA
jgi:hypothetical protein